MEARNGLNGRKQIHFDRVLIETTGLADPAPVAQTFFVDDQIAENYRLDAIVTVVDSKHAELQLDRGHEAQEQVAFSDVLLVNKVDLVSEEELLKLEKRLKIMNPAAKQYRTEQSSIDVRHILGLGAFELDKKDTLRYKGVLHIKGVEQRVIFQGVHMLFASAPDRKWKPSEVPISEFVIIGRNLDEDWFKSAFAGCVA